MAPFHTPSWGSSTNEEGKVCVWEDTTCARRTLRRDPATITRELTSRPVEALMYSSTKLSARLTGGDEDDAPLVVVAAAVESPTTTSPPVINLAHRADDSGHNTAIFWGAPPSTSEGRDRMILTTGHVKGPPTDALVIAEEDEPGVEVEVSPERFVADVEALLPFI